MEPCAQTSLVMQELLLFRKMKLRRLWRQSKSILKSVLFTDLLSLNTLHLFFLLSENIQGVAGTRQATNHQ